MKYIIEENIKNLKLILNRYTKKVTSYSSTSIHDAEKLWNAPLFFANILLSSDYSEPSVSDKELEGFKKKYELKNNVEIDLDFLFSKFWLRNVLGKIYIPTVIRKVTLEYKDRRNKLNELLFLKNLKLNHEFVEISLNEIKQSIKVYENQENQKIDSNWLFNSHFLKKKNNNSLFEINFNEHYTHLLENWERFKFINELLEYKNNKYKKSVIIERSSLLKIHTGHKSIFDKIPSLNDFLDKNILSETTKGYSISMRSEGSDYFFYLAGKIKAIIWQKLLNNNTFENDKQRILKMLSYSNFKEYRGSMITYLSENAKKRFKESAFKIVFDEPDLLPIENETDKVFLDHGMTSRNYWCYEIDELKETNNIHELYDRMLQVSDSSESDLFYTQDTRSGLYYLVSELLRMDNEYSDNSNINNFNNPNYPLTKRLLLEGLTKPYLLWSSACFLETQATNRLPYLLVEEEFQTLAFRLLDNIAIEVLPDETVLQIKTKILKIAIKLILDDITSNPNYDNQRLTNTIFQIFKEINRSKFEHINNSRTIERYEQMIIDKKNRESTLLNTIEEYSLNNNFIKKANTSIVSKLLPLLLDKVNYYLPNRELANGHWHFPLYKLDYLSWLSKVTVSCQLKKENLNINTEKAIAKAFIECYLSAIEKTKIQKKNYDSHETIMAIPSWYLYNENLDNIDWFFPFLLLSNNGVLSKLLDPSINFNLNKGIYDELNRYSIQRLRSHLFILLSTLDYINNHTSGLYSLRKKTKGLKINLENSIVEILKGNSTRSNTHKIDILNEFFERGYTRSQKGELIPYLANSINWFSHKKNIINVLIKTSDLIRLLIIVDWVTAEGVKKELIKKIKKSKITEFLKAQRSFTEIEILITKLTYQPKLIDHAKVALEYWKKIVTSYSKKDLEKTSYLVSLMIAYNNKNEDALNAIEVPEYKSFKIHNEFNFDNYKQFFRGLIRYKTNPKSSYGIFEKLYHQFPNHETIALNRFGAKVKWALNEKNRSLFEEALEEWKQIKSNISDSKFENIKYNVWVNQLTAYYNLHNTIEFNKLYLSIPIPYQMKEDMVGLKIKMLLKNQLRQDAKKTLYRAIDYHKDSSGKIPKFIKKLKEKLHDATDIKFLQNNFNEIFSSHPKTLIKIFPNSLNSENKIEKFITKEFALAGSKMLDKINSIREIKLEDKYNDLIQLGIEARISQWGWQIKDQTRGGFSANKNLYNPGERDIVICDSNSDVLLVCEAFMWKDKLTAENHINKIFNYYHKRKDFIILIYDKRQYKNFDKNWNNYVQQILPSLSYPEDFHLKKNKWKDLTNRFGYKSSAIKVGSSIHGKNTKIFHIMINLNYRAR